MQDAGRRAFYEVFIRNRRFVIPFFQRAYVWEEENWERFLNDMEDISKNNEQYFMGALVFKSDRKPSKDNIEDKFLIDGQQRITTLLLFFQAIKYLTSDENKKHACNSIIHNLFKEDGNDKEIILTHNLIDIEIFEAIMGDRLNDDLKDEYKYNKVFQCYQYFLNNEDIVAEMTPDIITNRMYFISVELEENEDEQQVFDILNTHGVSLNAAELLKNYIFETDDKEIYESTWKKTFEKDEGINKFWNQRIKYGTRKRSNVDFFLQAYLIKETDNKNTKLEKLFSNYKVFIKKKGIKNNNSEKKKFIKSLTSASKIYNTKFDPSVLDEFPVSSGHLYHLYVMNAVVFGLNIIQVIPYLLYIIEELENNKEQLNKILHLLNSYLIRRFICEKTPKRYPDIFPAFVRDKVNTYTELKKRIYAFSDEKYYGFPSDDEFKNCFLNSKLKNKASKIILILLEMAQHDPERSNSSLLPINTYTLEHIMPKKWEKYWTQPSNDEERQKSILSFGNLTILTKKLNAEISNNSWAKKKPEIKKYSSEIKIIEKYLKKNKWNESVIQTRGEFLFDIAKNLWKY